MEPVARGAFSEVFPEPTRPGAEVPLVRERSLAFHAGSPGLVDGLEAEARRQQALAPPFRRVLEVTRASGEVALVWEAMVGVTGAEVERRLAAEGRLLPLEAWLRVALEVTAVPATAPCGPAAGGGLASLGFDVRRRLVLFPDLTFSLHGPQLEGLLPAVPRVGRFDVGSLSPEQLKGQPAGPASRVFSAAWALAGLLTVSSPFLRASLMETLSAVVQGRLSWDPTAHPGCPPELGAVLRRGLLPEPERRWPDLPAFREALARAAGVAPAPLEAVATLCLGLDFTRVQARLRAAQERPEALPAAWRNGGVQVLEDGLLEGRVPPEALPPRRRGRA